MPELASFAPLIVPLVIGLILLRLVFDLLTAYTRRARQRGTPGVRPGWGRAQTSLFLSGLLLPLLQPVTGWKVNTAPIWGLFFLSLVLSALHARRSPGRPAAGAVPGTTLPVPAGTRRRPAQARTAPGTATGNTSAAPAPTRPSPEPPALAPRLDAPPSLDALDVRIAKLPMPPARKVGREALTGEQAEGWYAQRDLRLQRALQGKALASAQLRLSTLKSMLLLGQIGVTEADGDVAMMLRQAGPE